MGIVGAPVARNVCKNDIHSGLCASRIEQAAGLLEQDSKDKIGIGQIVANRWMVPRK